MENKRNTNKQYFIDLLIKNKKANALISQLKDIEIIEGFVTKHIKNV